MDDSEAWEVQNQRRIELIRKSAVETLTEAEQAELQSLQDAADRRLEERDWALLTQLDRLKRAIEQRASEARCTPAGTTAPGACTPRVQRVHWGMAKTPGGTLPRCWRKSAVCFSYPQGGRIASGKATSGSTGAAAEPGGAGRVVTVVGGRGELGDPDSGHGNKGKGEYHVAQA